jgi:NAD(P)H dehydrogenase (quinone)
VILVAGGTGRLGTGVANRLFRRGHVVQVLSRGSRPTGWLDPGIERVTCDVRDRAAVERAVSGATTVVSAIQGFVGSGGVTPASVDRRGNEHLVDAAARSGAEVVLVSVLRASPDDPMELARMKRLRLDRGAGRGLRTDLDRAARGDVGEVPPAARVRGRREPDRLGRRR